MSSCVLGYHGTSEKCAIKIEKEGYIESSTDRWLGSGIYFFGSNDSIDVDGKRDAKWWVTKKKKLKYWVIFEAEITSDNVLNIASESVDKKLYYQWYSTLLQKHLDAEKERKDFDMSVVFGFLDRKYKPDYIVAVFDAAKEYDGYRSRIMAKMQIQICVKDEKCIKENTEVERGIKDE